jgi:hypothetical protein
VPRAVRALRALPGKESDGMLGEILTSRRLGMFRAWPPTVRQAAGEGVGPSAPGAEAPPAEGRTPSGPAAALGGTSS